MKPSIYFDKHYELLEKQESRTGWAILTVAFISFLMLFTLYVSIENYYLGIQNEQLKQNCQKR